MDSFLQGGDRAADVIHSRRSLRLDSPAPMTGFQHHIEHRMEKNAGVQKVVRKTAGSGKVDYAPPVVLHETSRSRLVATAWFIPRSEGIEFSFTDEGFIKGKGKAWGEVKAKTLTLSEEASIQLLKYLQTHLPIAQQTRGNYIMLRAVLPPRP